MSPPFLALFFGVKQSRARGTPGAGSYTALHEPHNGLTHTRFATLPDYEGVGHGFAIRGDPKDDKVRKAADDAFVQSVNFIKANL